MSVILQPTLYSTSQTQCCPPVFTTLNLLLQNVLSHCPMKTNVDQLPLKVLAHHIHWTELPPSPAVCGPVQGIDFGQVAFQCLPGLQLYGGRSCHPRGSSSQVCVKSCLSCCLLDELMNYSCVTKHCRCMRNRVSTNDLISWKSHENSVLAFSFYSGNVG